VAFFGLLFFAGVTSSLAMGTPVMSFLMDEFSWKRNKAAIGFGLCVLVLGLPTVLFFQKGVFDEYDYWGGTVSLVMFAMLESVLFAWVFGLKKGWTEITTGADIKVPIIFKYIIKYITPVILIIVFFSSLIRPAKDDWSKLSLSGWKLHPESIIAQLKHDNIGPNKSYFSDKFYAEINGIIDSVYTYKDNSYISVIKEDGKTKIFSTSSKNHIMVQKNDMISTGDVIFEGDFINNVFYIDMSRLLLLTLFLLICYLVFLAYCKRKKEGSL